ncbi:MAG: YeeE/YedE family protein [Hyphomicrobiaceae bacterium]
MDFSGWIARFGDGGTAALIGFLIGVSFGVFSQKSKFCLRAAAIEFGRGTFGPRLAVWLFVFSGAVVGTQALIQTGVLSVSGARLLNMRASLSGAIIGGLMFGAGMVLARGCAGRLLVLAGQGNLRSLLTGLVFAVTAQASLVGILSPLRDKIANIWTFDGPALDALSLLNLQPIIGLMVAFVWLAAAIYFGAKGRIPLWGWVGGLGVGLTVASGWLITYWLSQQAFEPQPVKSMTFTGPSARALMLFLSPPGHTIDFDTGLVPGVLLGAFLAAFASRELKLEGFQDGQSMRRYMIGAVLMGFGGMLAGGCSVASVSGSAVFATLSWVTLFAIWAGAMATDRLIDGVPSAPTADATMPTPPIRASKVGA